MNNWIVCHRIEDRDEVPSTVQINRNNVIYIYLFADRLEIGFVNGGGMTFCFSEWEIKL